ncbi:hypothetical protein ACH42_06245 [Endozoicomonas sp. (ex Bugula neritina AB1)]|nr:hypothetical protein ACH42_06245 [Endozoicomonas sp. (ex Bugula neritina AB1)]
MIREFLQPETLQEALVLKAQHGDQAVFMASGARLNATPTKTTKPVAISLSGLGLKGIEQTGEGWELGALTTLQQIVDHVELPEGLREAAGLIFSRNMRNQITLGGEVAVNGTQCQVIPALLAMDAEIELAIDSGGSCRMTVEAWQQQSLGLITKVIIPSTLHYCRTEKVVKSCAGLPIVGVSLAVNEKEGRRSFGIALVGVTEKAVRLHDVEAMLNDGSLTREGLEEAVGKSVFPVSDHLGSAEYKRHISGVLVGLLIEEFNSWSK